MSQSLNFKEVAAGTQQQTPFILLGSKSEESSELAETGS